MAFGDVTSYQLSRLACDRWLPDTLLEGMASLLNPPSQDCLCLVLSEVCKFTLNKSIASALNIRKRISLIFLIVNVQIDAITGSSVASNTLMSGNHCTVVALDSNSKASFYGDSLGYHVPTNLLVELIQTLDYLSTALGERVDIHDLIPMLRPMENMHAQGIAKFSQYKHVLLFVGLLPSFLWQLQHFLQRICGHTSVHHSSPLL